MNKTIKTLIELLTRLQEAERWAKIYVRDQHFTQIEARAAQWRVDLVREMIPARVLVYYDQMKEADGEPAEHPDIFAILVVIETCASLPTHKRNELLSHFADKSGLSAENQTPVLISPALDGKAPPHFKNPRVRHGFRTCAITAVGAYMPERILANAELAQSLDITEEWILARTGIRERRLAAETEFTSDLAAHAARRAMDNAGITADQIDLIIVATNTADMLFPATACLVQAKIGARQVPAFDIKAAGSGFIYALGVGEQFIISGTCETVLVIGAEKLSSVVDWKDRNTCILFGDGAGAVILQHQPHRNGLLTVCLGGNGHRAGLLFMPGGGSQQPVSVQSVAEGKHFLRMDGRETFKAAVLAMHRAALEALRQCHLDLTDIKCIIPHQSNRRIIEAVASRLGASPNQIFMNVDKYGNTSGASIPIALAEAAECRRIQRGDLVLVLAFGAGLTWAAAVIEW